MSNEAVPFTTDALRLPQNCWGRVLETIDEGVVIVDDAGVVREVNRAAASWLQQPVDQIIGQPWTGPLASGPIELPVADRTAYFEAQREPIAWNDHPAHLIMLRPASPINQLTAEAYASVLCALPASGLIVDTQIDQHLPLAQADEMLVSQILANLMTNAMHYTPPGGQVTLSTAAHQQNDADGVTVTVTDTGPGISAQDLPHLLERFYRGEVGRRSGAPGTGLGLAICHDIALKLNGHITVDSQPGRGAAFTVWLRPVAAP